MIKFWIDTEFNHNTDKTSYWLVIDNGTDRRVTLLGWHFGDCWDGGDKGDIFTELCEEQVESNETLVNLLWFCKQKDRLRQHLYISDRTVYFSLKDGDNITFVRKLEL